MEKSATPVKWTQEQFGREGHVSVAEAARIAGVTPARIKKAIEAGEIAATSVWRGDSKRWFVPASEAERLGKIVSGR